MFLTIKTKVRNSKDTEFLKEEWGFDTKIIWVRTHRQRPRQVIENGFQHNERNPKNWMKSYLADQSIDAKGRDQVSNVNGSTKRGANSITINRNDIP